MRLSWNEVHAGALARVWKDVAKAKGETQSLYDELFLDFESLRPVDIHHAAITALAGRNVARKLGFVLSQRVATARNSLIFTKTVLDPSSPSVNP